VQGIGAFYPWEHVVVQGVAGARIDSVIAPWIDVLNRKGYKTWVSCSGLAEDHLDGGHAGAYLGMVKANPLLEGVLTRAGWSHREGDSYYMYDRQPNGRYRDGFGRQHTQERCLHIWLTTFLLTLDLPTL
jgi:hypothetical protein